MPALGLPEGAPDGSHLLVQPVMAAHTAAASAHEQLIMHTGAHNLPRESSAPIIQR
jgi:hypothetical protein